MSTTIGHMLFYKLQKFRLNQGIQFKSMDQPFTTLYGSTFATSPKSVATYEWFTSNWKSLIFTENLQNKIKTLISFEFLHFYFIFHFWYADSSFRYDFQMHKVGFICFQICLVSICNGVIFPIQILESGVCSARNIRCICLLLSARVVWVHLIGMIVKIRTCGGTCIAGVMSRATWLVRWIALVCTVFCNWKSTKIDI